MSNSLLEHDDPQIPERVRHMAELYAQGLTHARVADQVGLSSAYVGLLLRRYYPGLSRSRGWRGDPERHAAVGRQGGRKVSQDRAYMAALGRKGGLKLAQDRAHMSQIGKKGGQARKARTRTTGALHTEYSSD
jgi:general stress protein YciG